MFTAIGSFNFQQLFSGVSNGMISGSLLTFAGLGLFMGAVGKIFAVSVAYMAS